MRLVLLIKLLINIALYIECLVAQTLLIVRFVGVVDQVCSLPRPLLSRASISVGFWRQERRHAFLDETLLRLHFAFLSCEWLYQSITVK